MWEELPANRQVVMGLSPVPHSTLTKMLAAVTENEILPFQLCFRLPNLDAENGSRTMIQLLTLAASRHLRSLQGS